MSSKKKARIIKAGGSAIDGDVPQHVLAGIALAAVHRYPDLGDGAKSFLNHAVGRALGKLENLANEEPGDLESRARRAEAAINLLARVGQLSRFVAALDEGLEKYLLAPDGQKGQVLDIALAQGALQLALPESIADASRAKKYL